MVIPAYSVFEHKNGGENGYYKTGEKVDLQAPLWVGNATLSCD